MVILCLKVILTELMSAVSKDHGGCGKKESYETNDRMSWKGEALSRLESQSDMRLRLKQLRSFY